MWATRAVQRAIHGSLTMAATALGGCAGPGRPAQRFHLKQFHIQLGSDRFCHAPPLKEAGGGPAQLGSGPLGCLGHSGYNVSWP